MSGSNEAGLDTGVPLAVVAQPLNTYPGLRRVISEKLGSLRRSPPAKKTWGAGTVPVVAEFELKVTVFIQAA
jgi:hypothetical protein